MKNKIFIPILFSASFLSACQEAPKHDNHPKTSDEIVTATLLDKEHNTALNMYFNNTKNTATLQFKGEKIELIGQRTGSGIWYKNNHYELRGKGDDLELQKDGQIIFKSN